MPAPGPDPASSALHLANTTDSDYPRQLRVHDLLEAQARLCPSATAVEFDGQSLIYADLQERAN
jgi:non-ribosomal peptide synthetase component F